MRGFLRLGCGLGCDTANTRVFMNLWTAYQRSNPRKLRQQSTCRRAKNRWICCYEICEVDNSFCETKAHVSKIILLY
jgi:hypothetical protein